VQPQVGETWLYLLQFVMKSIDAEAQAKYLSLGAYHSAGVFAPECPASAAEPALLTFGRGFHGQLVRALLPPPMPFPIALVLVWRW
jgi:hypothetical protein